MQSFRVEEKKKSPSLNQRSRKRKNITAYLERHLPSVLTKSTILDASFNYTSEYLCVIRLVPVS